MKKRIEKLETAFGAADKPRNLNDPISREMAEALHLVCGEPGTPVDYTISWDLYPALRAGYRDDPELLAMQREAYAAQREAYGDDWMPVDYGPA